jgi:hypothetical protein
LARIGSIGIPDSRELFVEKISIIKSQLSRDLSANNHLRLFETDSGYLGLAPEKSAGDLVCILNFTVAVKWSSSFENMATAISMSAYVLFWI